MYERHALASGGLISVESSERRGLEELWEEGIFAEVGVAVGMVDEAMLEAFGGLDVAQPGVEELGFADCR